MAGLKDALDVLQDLHAQCGKLRAAVVERRVVDGAQDSVRDVGGTGDLEKMAAGVEGHGYGLAVEEPSSVPKLSLVLNPRPRATELPWGNMIPGIPKNVRKSSP
jgi:hypothetical protein